MRGVETEWQRLGDIARGTEVVLRGLEAFCKSGGSEVIFAGIMAPLHPLPLFTVSSLVGNPLYILIFYI